MLQQSLRLQSAQSVMLSAAIAARLGMNQVDLECLDILQIYGPLPAGQLASHASLSTATMTSVIDRLEKLGFVTRDRSGPDRRVVLVRLEQTAVETIGPCYLDLLARMEELQGDFTDEELETVTRFARRSSEAVAATIRSIRDGALDPAPEAHGLM